MIGVGGLEILILVVFFVVFPIAFVWRIPRTVAGVMAALFLFISYVEIQFYAQNQREIQRLMENFDFYMRHYSHIVYIGIFLFLFALWCLGCVIGGILLAQKKKSELVQEQ